MHRDNAITVSAIAVLAACLAATAHEALGHGAACLARGGTITQLTSVYFQCSVADAWVAGGGLIGNLAAAVAAWMVLSFLPKRMARARLLAFLATVINLFWFAGYLVYAVVMNDGDPYFVARDVLGPPTVEVRAGGIAAGVALYAIGIAIARGFTRTFAKERARALLHLSWAAAAVSACAAALAFAPDRLAASQQGALEVGAACLPLLARFSIAPSTSDAAPEVTVSAPWIAAACVCFAVFVLTLGRGVF
ncbi:MAG TPA: hypothetical protein VG841_02105 [Caulobacterales bacterium]|nr:hypothetical protein [Caulobacterales bacterium]